MVTQDSIFIQYHNNDNCGSMLTEKLINIFYVTEHQQIRHEQKQKEYEQQQQFQKH